MLGESLGYESKTCWWRRILHYRYVEDRRYPGWEGFLPFYRFHCPKHGYVVDYPHGHGGWLSCPKCREEMKCVE